MKKIYYLAFIYLILGLIFGVFYREFTSYHNFEGSTQLSVLHTHTLILGMIFFLIVLLLDQVYKISESKRFTYWLITYNIGFIGLLLTLFIRGMGQVLMWELAGFNHVAGLFHTVLGIAFIWFFIILGKSINNKSA